MGHHLPFVSVDVVVAGAGVAGQSAALAAAGQGARVLIEEAPDRVEDLRRLGVGFEGELGLDHLRGSPSLLAGLIARCALAREESRGGHFRADYPHESGALDGLHTVARLGAEPELERWS